MKNKRYIDGFILVFMLLVCMNLVYSLGVCEENELEVCIERGTEYLSQRKFKKAEVEFKKALNLDSNNESVIFNLGKIYIPLEEYDEALKWNNRFIEVFPDSPKLALVYNNIANIYLKKKDYSKAKKYIQKALFVFPDMPLILSTEGEIYAAQGIPILALVKFEEALANLDKDTSAYIRQEINNNIEKVKKQIESQP